MSWEAKFVHMENEQKILSALFLGDHITVCIIFSRNTSSTWGEISRLL